MRRWNIEMPAIVAKSSPYFWMRDWEWQCSALQFTNRWLRPAHIYALSSISAFRALTDFCRISPPQLDWSCERSDQLRNSSTFGTKSNLGFEGFNREGARVLGCGGYFGHHLRTAGMKRRHWRRGRAMGQ